MKLSLSIDASEDSSDGSTSPDYPDIKRYSTEKISGILGEYLAEIFPTSKDYDSADISLTFTSPDNIRALNREYRDIDEATDVLSFPMLDSEIIPAGMPALLLGDIVICPEEVQRLHPELSCDEGICLMIAHSFLHLLGYDHDTQEAESAMWAKQDEISRKILEVLE